MEYNKLERMVADKNDSNPFFGSVNLLESKTLSDEDCMEQVLHISSRLISEVVEVQKECNLDFWKKGFTFDKSKLKEEIIDCLHIIISMSVITGMDAEEVFEVFKKKGDKNSKRKDWTR